VVVEAVQHYVTMVNGLSKMTRAKALSTARMLLVQAGLDEVAADAQERVSKLAEEILQASKANRELIEHVVGAEVDKAASRWGFVRAEELDQLRREITELRLAMAYEAANASTQASESQARDAGEQLSSQATQQTIPLDDNPPARKAPARKKATAKKATAKKATAKKATAKKSPARKSAGANANSGTDPATAPRPAKKSTKKAASKATGTDR
jgi:membrane protein involved in colicin uptake